jgi:hypothetical protein
VNCAPGLDEDQGWNDITETVTVDVDDGSRDEAELDEAELVQRPEQGNYGKLTVNEFHVIFF